MVQAPSLWAGSKRPAGHHHGRGHDDQEPPRAPQMFNGANSHTAQDQVSVSTLSQHDASSNIVANLKARRKHKARAPSFTSSPLTQRPLSPAATSDGCGSDTGSASATSTAAAIDIPTKRGARLSQQRMHSSNGHSAAEYPGPSLGMYAPHEHLYGSTPSRSHRRHSSTLAAFAETIQESSSSSSDEAEESRDRAFEEYLSRCGISPGNTASPSAMREPPTFGSPVTKEVYPRNAYPAGLGIRPALDDKRRPRNTRRSLPSSTSTSPMQTVLPGSSSLSPSAIKSSRRRSSGNHSPLGSIAIGASPGSPSPSLFSSSFVGSYEHSLLSGRMANKPSNMSTPLPFTASVGVLGLGKGTPRGLKCPEHVTIPFGAYFWDMDSSEKQGKGSPYVGTLDLTEYYTSMLLKDLRSDSALLTSPDPGSSSSGSAGIAKDSLPSFPGYRIPPKGQLQIVIKNANQTGVKLFLVPYDLSDMPSGTKTFLRQKSYDIPPGNVTSHVATGPGSPSATPPPKETLRYAIHLHFCSLPADDHSRGRKARAAAANRSSHRENSPTRLRGGTNDNGDRQASSHRPDHNEHRNAPVQSTESMHERRPRRRNTNSAVASHIYLYKTIRVAFASRALDQSEKLKVVVEGPSGVQNSPKSKDTLASSADGPVDKDKYSPFVGPGEEWEEAKRMRMDADIAQERHIAQLQRLQIQMEDPVPFDPNGELVMSTDTAAQGTYARLRADSHMSTGSSALLNTPPQGMSAQSHTSLFSGHWPNSEPSASLLELAPVPEPLVFVRSPVGRQSPLPGLQESGLAISRPGSRARNRAESPIKHSYPSPPGSDALR